MTFGERLIAALHRAGVSRKELGESLGISVQAIAQAINGRRDRGGEGSLSYENTQKAAALLGVSAKWLMSGVGEMALDPVDTAKYAAGGALTPQAHELGLLFDLVDPADRVARARAYNAASEAILRLLAEAADDKPRQGPGGAGPAGTPAE